MPNKEYRQLPRTGENYEPPLGKLCRCVGCFRTIPPRVDLCVPCELGYHGSPVGTHGYGEGKMT